MLRDQFGLNIIETGTLLKKEAQKQSEIGLKIDKAFKNKEYVDDEIVCEVLKKKIEECEKDNKDYVIEGFPRTKVQALKLGHLGVVPDKIICLNASEENQANKLKQNILEIDPNMKNEEIEMAVKNQLL